MNKDNKPDELLSALIDGEVARGQIGRGLDSLLSSEQSRSTWQRYHLIGDIMRGDAVHPRSHTIADKLGEVLNDEPAILAPRNTRVGVSHWAQPVAGAAIAASVAVAAVIGVGLLTPAGTEISSSSTKLVNTPLPVDRANLRPVAGTYWSQQQPAVENKLNRYLMDHNELSAAGRYKGALPYASFVSYDRQK